jgi:hypothetical protein
MIAGAGVQYKASTDAQERQRREIAASLAAQRDLQMQAEQKAIGAAKEFETPKRAAEQEQLAASIEQSLIKPVSESQAIRAEQHTTQGNVSDDYTTAKAKSDLETVKAAEQLARLLGKTTSAGRLRMNEGIRLMDTGQDVDRLAGFSRGRAGADNIAIQQAGNVDAGQVLLGSLLQSAGSAGLMYGGGTVDKLAVNAEPTIAASPGMAPVYDVSKVVTARVGGNAGNWLRSFPR